MSLSKNKFRLMVMVSAILIAGCAGLATKNNELTIIIQPKTIMPGRVVTVTAISVKPLTKLAGRIDLLGAPLIPMKSKDGLHWSWQTQVPMEAAWQAGRYHLIFEGQTISGEKIFGEAWVDAP